MNRKWMILVFLCAFLLPGLAGAVEKDDFVIDTTADLIDLSTALKSDPLHKEAVHFCIGYLVGAYQYHVVENAGLEGRRLIPRLPEPRR